MMLVYFNQWKLSGKITIVGKFLIIFSKSEEKINKTISLINYRKWEIVFLPKVQDIRVNIIYQYFDYKYIILIFSNNEKLC